MYRTALKKTVESKIAEQFGPVIGYINYLSTLLERTPEQEAVWQQVSAFFESTVAESKQDNLDDFEAFFGDVEID